MVKRISGGDNVQNNHRQINRHRHEQWDQEIKDTNSVLETKIYESDCTMGTLPMAACTFHDEIQIDWGSFAWKAFKSEIKRLFKKKGIPEAELQPFDEYKEYGVVYIDK